METIVDWESSSAELSDDDGIYGQDANDEEDYLCLSGSVPKLQFRKCLSTARWNDQMEMAEVLENKGRIWTTTGIVRCGKIYCSIEETLFLSEVGALHLLDDDGKSLSLKDVYQKIAEGNSSCFWEQFEVYRHLKSLGFIVGRHSIPWSVKINKNGSEPVSAQTSVEDNESPEIESRGKRSISELLNAIQLDEPTPIYDVYLPNSKFKKSSPGDPNFMVCLTGEYPPPKGDIEIMEKKSGGIPVKYCHVEHGRVCFFSFDKVQLPVLP